MESMLVAIGGVILVLALLGGLSAVNRRQTKRMIADVSRTPATRRYDYGLQGDVLPAEETSLGPVRYERIPAAQPVGYSVETRQPRHIHTVETGFLVPALTAMATALFATVAAGSLALAFGWPARTLLIVFGLSLIGGWAWRVLVNDRLVWQVEKWLKKDLDGDGYQGAPMTTHLAAVQPDVARADVARQTRQTATNERLAWLQAFVHRCYLTGCSESAQGIKPGDRAKYLEARDIMLRLGLAQWRDDANKRLGWELVADEGTAISIVANHVTEL